MTLATGIVLAAGAGTRFGRPKADVIVDGTRLLDRAVATLRAGGCTQVVAVVRLGVQVADATVVVNHEPERGMGSSLGLGLTAASGALAVMLLVDLPGVTPAAVRAVIDAATPVAVATYDGRPGHPVAIARLYWDEVAALAVGDRGARPFLRAHPELVVHVPCEGDPSDVDTQADLARWQRHRPT